MSLYVIKCLQHFYALSLVIFVPVSNRCHAIDARQCATEAAGRAESACSSYSVLQLVHDYNIRGVYLIAISLSIMPRYQVKTIPSPR